MESTLTTRWGWLKEGKKTGHVTGWWDYSTKSSLHHSHYSAFLPSHSLMSHCKAPSWQRLEWLRKEIAVTNIAVAMAKVHLFCFNAMPGTLQHTIKTQSTKCLVCKSWKPKLHWYYRYWYRKHVHALCVFNSQGSNQVLQPMVTVAPSGTLMGVGGCPEAWCCRWMQPHSSGGTQLPFCCSRPWRRKHSIQKNGLVQCLCFCFGSFGFNMVITFPLHLHYNAHWIYVINSINI